MFHSLFYILIFFPKLLICLEKYTEIDFATNFANENISENPTILNVVQGVTKDYFVPKPSEETTKNDTTPKFNVNKNKKRSFILQKKNNERTENDFAQKYRKDNITGNIFVQKNDDDASMENDLVPKDDNDFDDERKKKDFVPRVVNGWPAKLGDAPYQLAFKNMVSRISRQYRTFCGGVIIGEYKVLSAAHCFEEKGLSKCLSLGRVGRKYLARSVAVAGNLYNAAYRKSDSLQNGQWRDLRSMYYPKTYRFPRNDISVGFTKRPWNFNAYVAPIPYATTFADYSGKCLGSGYGRTSNIQKMTSEVLLLAHLDITPTARCSRQHRQNMIKFVCTDIVNTDVGKGDSGGPLVCLKTGDPKEGTKGILVGIVSGSRIRVGSFFTRVSSYSNFIARSKTTSYRFNNVLIFLCILYGIDVLFLFCFTTRRRFSFCTYSNIMYLLSQVDNIRPEMISKYEEKRI